MIVAMENFIPDRRAISSEKASPTSPTPQIHTAAWLRRHKATAHATTRRKTGVIFAPVIQVRPLARRSPEDGALTFRNCNWCQRLSSWLGFGSDAFLAFNTADTTVVITVRQDAPLVKWLGSTGNHQNWLAVPITEELLPVVIQKGVAVPAHWTYSGKALTGRMENSS